VQELVRSNTAQGRLSFTMDLKKPVGQIRRDGVPTAINTMPCEKLSTYGDVLKGEMATIMQELHAAPDKFHRELERLLELLAAQRRFVDSQVGRSTRGVLQHGEMAEAQVVLAAQQRLKYAASGRGVRAASRRTPVLNRVT
jgi:hypothetical protein